MCVKDGFLDCLEFDENKSPSLLAGFVHYRDFVCLNQTGG